MLNRVHRTVKFLANTEGRGNVTPTDIDLAIHNSVQEKYEELFFEVNRLVNRQNRGLINSALENTPDKVREKLQHYIEDLDLNLVDGVFTIPENIRYFDSVIYQNTFIELCKNNKDFLLSASEASLAYPIGLKQSQTVKILPNTIESVTVSYLRNPVVAKWTYTVVSGVEMFDQSKSDFKEIDIHPSEETDLILRVLFSFGINLKEKDLQLATMSMKSTDFNKEITN